MKKLFIAAALAVSTLSLQAQQVLNLSTVGGTKLERYDGNECKVNVDRYLFNGWNTLALPFDVSESELNEAYGPDCRLERLVGAEEEAGVVTLYFQDCKAQGVVANTPYILYYTGQNGVRRLAKTAVITNGEPTLSLDVRGSGERVTMAGARQVVKGEGLYGVLAVDNADARFVAVDNTKGGFHATRCYVELTSGNTKTLRTRHLAAGETTAIAAALSTGERADVYTLSGIRVATNASAADISRLQPGIYVVNGQKVAVK